MIHALRDYQVRLNEDLEAAWTIHDRVLICLPTGAGKTKTAVEKARELLRRRVGGLLAGGSNVLWLVQRNHLVENPAAEFTAAGIPFGYIKAGFDPEPDLALQIASIQTLKKRGTEMVFDFIVVDEAHNADFDDWLLTQRAKVVGLTATPTRNGGKPLGSVWQKLLIGATYQGLMQRGILVPHRVWTVDLPDLRALKVSPATGDVPEGQQAAIMCKPELVGSVGTWWSQLCRGKSTLVFCVNIAHAELVVRELQGLGARVGLVTGDTHMDERHHIQGRMAAGTLDVIVNVSVYKEGLDIPSLRCVIIARSARSLPFWIQACNRGSRSSPGKTEFILVDMVGAFFEHGSPMLDRPWRLEENAKAHKKRGLEGGLEITTCRKCHFVRPKSEAKCPECGDEMKPVVRKLGKRGQLVEVKEDVLALLKPAAPLTGRHDEENKQRRYWFKQADIQGIPRSQQFRWVMARMNEKAKPVVPITGMRSVIKDGSRFTVPNNPKEVF